MADLSDEDKVKTTFGDVDDSKETDETAKDDKTAPDEEKTSPEVTATTEESEAKVDDTTAEPDTSPSLTKPYDWLKGETPEQWTGELKNAYDKSTEEALKLKKRAEDAEALIEEAKRVIANQSAAPTGGQAATPPADSPLNLDSHPALQYAKTLQEQSMIKDWGEFAKKYPQASDPDGFSQIEKASTGAAQAFVALNGRQPTYAELFEETAALLRWQPSDQKARKDAAIKEAASSTQTASSSSPTKRTNVTEEQLRVARRLFPTQTDEEIVKDLANYVTT